MSTEKKICQVCNLEITSKNYRRHMKSQHNLERLSVFPKMCPYCHQMKRGTNLSRHIKHFCKQRPEKAEPKERFSPKDRKQCGLCDKGISKNHYRRHFRLCKMKKDQKQREAVEFSGNEHFEFFFEVEESPRPRK